MTILDRYILRDILKTLLLTAAILVSVIAFGAAIKPLADDQLLSAAQVIKYIGLAMIPMLQFALPFSAGFAATLVMHRMTADNEVLAMSVGGQSYRRVAAPVAGLGLVLLVLMATLTQWIIPRFWGQMEEMIAADVTRVFESSIKRGEPFEIGSVQIFADRMLVVDDPPDTDADTRLVLMHVAAAELDHQRRIVTDVTARQAAVDIYRRDGRTYLKLILSDAVAYSRGSGQLVQTDEIRPDRAIAISNALADNPLTMSQSRLLELYANPDGFTQVIDARATLAASIRDAELFELLDERLRRDRRIELKRRDPFARQFYVEAAGLRHGVFEPGPAGVLITELRDDVEIRRYRAAKATLRRTGSLTLGAATFELDLENCEVTDPGQGSNRRARLALESLVVVDDGSEDLSALSSVELIAHAADHAEAPNVKFNLLTLERMLRELKDDIVSKLNERYALSVTAPLLLLLGSLLAMLLRNSLPLTVYVWAFLPSVVDLILISSGAQLIRDGRPIGLAVLWAGNGVLLFLVLLTYVRLARN